MTQGTAGDTTATPTAGALLFSEDLMDVLLVRHTDGADHLTGTYSIPAGRLRDNEDEITAAIRELNEETGVTVSPDELLQLPTTYSATRERKNGVATFTMRPYIGVVPRRHRSSIRTRQHLNSLR